MWKEEKGPGNAGRIGGGWGGHRAPVFLKLVFGELGRSENVACLEVPKDGVGNHLFIRMNEVDALWTAGYIAPPGFPILPVLPGPASSASSASLSTCSPKSWTLTALYL